MRSTGRNETVVAPKSRSAPALLALLLLFVGFLFPLLLARSLPGPPASLSFPGKRRRHSLPRPPELPLTAPTDRGKSSRILPKLRGRRYDGGEDEGKEARVDHGIPVWVFLYLWYGNPALDGKYWHWTHPILPHWDAEIAKKYPHGVVEAPDHVASPGGVRPARGLYSSSDPDTLIDQMTELWDAGVTGAIVSWWGRKGGHDNNGPATEPVHMRLAFEAAERKGVVLSVHLEPYEGRTAKSVCEDLSFLLDQYGSSPSWDPRVYVYDSYLIKAIEWKRVMSKCSARKRVQLVALILRPQDVATVAAPGGFDGVYTYFASVGFTPASNPALWPSVTQSAQKAGLFFVPCVGPGYDDSTIRPWNEENTRDRRGGEYFREMWRDVPRGENSISAVAITSYNEWAEGTMIEPTEEDGGQYMDILTSLKW